MSRKTELGFKKRVFYHCRQALNAIYVGLWACAISYTIYNISKSLAKYLEKPVNTRIQVAETENGTMEFPTISICHEERVSKVLYDQDPILGEIWDAVGNIAFSTDLDWTNERYSPYRNFTYHDVYQFSPTWEETLLSCTHAGVRYCDKLLVSQDDLMEEEYGPSGRCFRFNPKGKIKSKAGDYGAVYLRLNTSSGFVIDVHHHSQSSVTRNTGIPLSPGFKYKIGVRVIEREELDQELGGDCDKSRVKCSYGDYDVESCKIECRDEVLMGECGCIPWIPPYNVHNWKHCTLEEMNKCGNLAYLHYVIKESDTRIKGYDCVCPVPCKTTAYPLQIATTGLSKARTNKDNSPDVLQHTVKLELFFSDMYVEKISQIPAYDFWNLLADVGGMMGLLLGASIFTVVEVGTNLFKKLYDKYSRKSGCTKSGHIFVQYGCKVRRVEVPTLPISLDKLADEMVDAFSDTLTLMDLVPIEAIYIMDEETKIFYQLVDQNDVVKGSQLKIHEDLVMKNLS